MTWQKLPLGQMTDPKRPITYGVVKPGPEDPSQGVLFVRGGDIRDGKIALDSLRTITQDYSRPYARTILRGGELLISLVGNPGEVAIVPASLAGANIARQAGLIALRPEFDSRYVMYFMKSPAGRAGLFERTQGAVQQVINLAALKTVKIYLPELPEQHRIAGILSTYDDLIENNRRRIALLEEAARQLYKEWFVRFRFPGHEHVKIIDGVPEGWDKKTYGDMFAFLSGFAFKSSTYIEDGQYGIVTIKNVHDGRFEPNCSSKIAQIPQQMNGHCLLSTGDILLSLTGNVGRACVVFGDKLLLNQRVAKVVGKNAAPASFVYWTFSNPDTQRELENLAFGVAQLNLSPVKLAGRPFLRPPSALMQGFAEVADGISAQMIKLNQSVVELAKARDLLLPRLMSGSLAV